MGGHYGSIQIRSENRQIVTAAAEEIARASQIHILVAPPVNGWIALFPEGHGQDDALGRAVAAQMDADVLQLMVHDDDIFAYWYYRDQNLVDSYWSSPGYFGEENRQKEEAMSGRPEAFRHLIGDEVSNLAKLLDRDADFTFEYERLEKFGKLLKISNAVNAFENLKLGERNGIRQWRQFVEVPAERVTSEAQQKQNKRRQLSAERKRLKAEGLLLQDDQRSDISPYACWAADGFLVAWPDYRRGAVSFDWYGDPCKAPASIALGTPDHLAGIASSAAASRIAFTAGHRVCVWDFRDGKWSHVCDVPEEDHSVAVAVSPDGNLLAHASRCEIVITQIDPHQTILSIATGATPRRLAIHPSMQWLAVSGNTLGLVALKDAEAWRELYVGGKADQPPSGSMAQLQIDDAKIEELAKKYQTTWDKVIAQMTKGSEHSKEAPLTQEQIEGFRRRMSRQWEQSKAQLLMLKEGHMPVKPARAIEQVLDVGFSRDGRWFWCGTQAGLRVYEWESVPRTSGSDMPNPKWHFEPPGDSSSFFGPQVTAIAEEVDLPAIAFGGSGRLYRLDLRTGEVKELITMSQHAAITGLVFSKDGHTLGMTTHAIGSSDAAALRHQTWGWSIWSYMKLTSNIH